MASLTLSTEPGGAAEPAEQRLPRRLKACQTCRRQKMRCDGNPETPCQRCVNTGKDCVFDLVGRKHNPDSTSGGAQKRKLDALQEELRVIQDQMREFTESVSRHRSGAVVDNPQNSPQLRTDLATDVTPAGNPVRGQRWAVGQEHRQHDQDQDTVNATGPDEPPLQRPAPEPAHSTLVVSDITNPVSDGLDQITLKAPLTAVHAMSPPISLGPRTDGCGLGPRTDSSQSLQHSPSLLVAQDDFISRLFQDDSYARNLYALYLSGANSFLPLFDPITDSFDSLRQRSPFCLVTILYICLCQTQHGRTGLGESQESLKDAAAQESRRLATASLFANPATLECVQAMILLAAYAEKVWFAIGHALQMALDLGLDTAVDRLINNKPVSAAETHKLVRHARTWLILHHIERELAYGTARKPRMANVNSPSLRNYISLPMTLPQDIRYISTIELVRIRGAFLAEAETSLLQSSSPLHWIESVQQRIREWYCYWDSEVAKYETDISSFQRSSLSIQSAFASITLSCHVLSKMQQNQSASSHDDEAELMRNTAVLALDLLRFIGSSGSYRWHFRWAPTYSSLMLTYVVIFAFQVSKKWPHVIDMPSLVVTINPIIQMLAGYPYLDGLAGQVQQMVQESQNESAALETTGGGFEPDGAAYEGGPSSLGPQQRTGGPQFFGQSETTTPFDYEGIGSYLAPGFLENSYLL
ncbi:hypothetical protein F5Y08DRAFT_320624 [Xylaria arbuscula]|nr:hypothetical protein F5Y08DRAFT_320624 [Xylaria arbuscula]